MAASVILRQKARSEGTKTPRGRARHKTSLYNMLGEAGQPRASGMEITADEGFSSVRSEISLRYEKALLSYLFYFSSPDCGPWNT